MKKPREDTSCAHVKAFKEQGGCAAFQQVEYYLHAAKAIGFSTKVFDIHSQNAMKHSKTRLKQYTEALHHANIHIHHSSQHSITASRSLKLSTEKQPPSKFTQHTSLATAVTSISIIRHPSTIKLITTHCFLERFHVQNAVRVVLRWAHCTHACTACTLAVPNPSPPQQPPSHPHLRVTTTAMPQTLHQQPRSRATSKNILHSLDIIWVCTMMI